MSPETARRRCEEGGRRVEEQQTAEAQQFWKEETSEQEDTHHLAVSADGAMVPLSGGTWAEVRTRALGKVPVGSADQEKVHIEDLSYFSRLSDAAHFTDVAEVETHRRRLVQAKEVCAVMDGAEWLQPFVDMRIGRMLSGFWMFRRRLNT